MTFEKLMRFTITYQLPIGRNSGGDVQYAAQATAKAYYQEHSDLERLTDDVELVVETMVATYAPLTQHARVWLEDADTSDVSQALTVLGIKRAKSLTGRGSTYVQARCS